MYQFSMSSGMKIIVSEEGRELSSCSTPSSSMPTLSSLPACFNPPVAQQRRLRQKGRPMFVLALGCSRIVNAQSEVPTWRVKMKQKSFTPEKIPSLASVRWWRISNGLSNGGIESN